MRRAITIIAMLMLLISNIGLAEGDTASPNDYGVYLYFGSLLGDFNSVLDGVLEGRNTTLRQADVFYARTNVTYEEVLLYSSYGIDPKAGELSRYFKMLGEGVFEIASNGNALPAYIQKGEYARAREALFLMKMGLNECYESLGYISNAELVGEKGERLSFELKDSHDKLESIGRMIERYEEMLGRSGVPSEFSISISNPSPKVHENITFYGYTMGLEDISVIINGSVHRAEITRGNFYFNYSFERPGTYEVYAMGVNGSEKVVSGKLLVNVSRVPTRIVANEVTSGGIIVEGYLLDYFGDGVPGEEIELHIENESLHATTSPDGAFNFTVGNLLEGINATLLFGGNEIYEGSNVTLFILPLKEKPIIRLFYDGDRVRAGDEITIRGTVNVKGMLPLTIYVDEEPYNSIDARGNFTFPLKLGTGKHRIYAYFAGNEELAPGTSNVLLIEAVPVSYAERAMLLVFFMLLAFLAYKWITKPGTRAKAEESKVPEEAVQVETHEEEPSILRAYRVVYGLLRRVYHISKCATPREILVRLREEPFSGELEMLTALHERYFYGKKKLGIKDALRAARSASRIILGIFVRDEL